MLEYISCLSIAGCQGTLLVSSTVLMLCRRETEPYLYHYDWFTWWCYSFISRIHGYEWMGIRWLKLGCTFDWTRLRSARESRSNIPKERNINTLFVHCFGNDWQLMSFYHPLSWVYLWSDRAQPIQGCVEIGKGTSSRYEWHSRCPLLLD